MTRRVGRTRQVALDLREPRFAVAREIPESILGQRARLGEQLGAAPHQDRHVDLRGDAQEAELGERAAERARAAGAGQRNGE